jgi:TRAP-type C4-dicarboxylate transport system permease small subunit
MNPSPVIMWLARVLAILGGVVLVVITVLTVVSILGRAAVTVAYMGEPGDGMFFQWLTSAARVLVDMGAGPVPGDFELVEAGTGFAVFAFLPWCQLNRGHATVDLFTSFLSDGVNRIIDLVSELLMTLVIVLIAWRLWAGLMDKLRYGETTFILQFPIWWAFAACMAAAAVGVVVTIYMLFIRIQEVRMGRPLLSQRQESGH